MSDSIFITPEIKEAIISEVNSLLMLYGIWGVIPLIIIAITLKHLTKKYIDKLVEVEIREYQSELDKNSLKTIEIWRFKKDVIFEFMKFMDENIFFNPKLNSAEEKEEESKRVFRELNFLYAKLFAVFDKSMIENINQILNGSVSEIQRFYLYREIRKELQGYLSDDEPEDCPYINREATNILTPENIDNANNAEKLKEIYPFIEQGDKESTIKGMPFYGK